MQAHRSAMPGQAEFAPDLYAAARHDVLAVYGLHLLHLMAERGHAAPAVLAGTAATEARLRTPAARISAADYATMVFNALRLACDPALGLELGLRARPTMHGHLGLALLSCPTVREALVVGRRFMRARMPFITFDHHVEGDSAVVELREAVVLGPLRPFAHEMFLAEMTGTCRALLEDSARQNQLLESAELGFQHAQPAYFDRYRRLLPHTRFGCASSYVRFPACFLDAPLHGANPVVMEMAVEQCERELALAGIGQDLLARVRALLSGDLPVYPGLRDVAGRLAMSPSTLKRGLRHHGTTFIKLREETRLRDSLHLLGNTALPVERVAGLLGYSDPANFTRAFRRWTGCAPTCFRAEASLGQGRHHSRGNDAAASVTRFHGA